jgi:amino acid adenylation domain-containing protein
MIYTDEKISIKNSGGFRGTLEEPTSASVMARIAHHADDRSDQTAIVDGSLVLSFGEFETRSNQLAHYLIENGVGVDSTVVLLFDRSADFVISALAVMKAGAAYVPMDSSTPADRAAYVIANSSAQALLTHHGKARAVVTGSAKVIELDGTAAKHITNQSADAPAIECAPDNLAYVVYTSGSTGRPKGAEISHGNLNCLIEWHQNAFGLTHTDRASHVAGLGFDVVGWELWPNLSAGAALHIADETTRRSPDELQQWMLDQKITVAFAPTVLAEQLLQAKWPKTASLRWMLTGGEALNRRPSSEQPFSFANCYGPAECTVVATSCRVSPGGNETPTIGRAIPNTSTLILDENLKPVAHGEPGELCLAGAHVGRGYRNNPELTARCFINYTLADGSAPVRIYRTGDRARELPNGELAFLGRLDDQVKIRGYRIEPGEISAWLDKLDAIKKSTVIARDLGNGLELIAYIVFNAPAVPPAIPIAIPTVAELRAYLATKVPDYMVPTQFVLLPAFATTVNGKVDKAALPMPCPSNRLPSDNAVETAPPESAASDLENRIGAIIAALLGQPTVKGTDNFFMLGGHSMLGVQLAAKIRDTIGVKLTLRQLFGAPTVNGLCAEIRRLNAAAPTAQQRKL